MLSVHLGRPTALESHPTGSGVGWDVHAKTMVGRGRRLIRFATMVGEFTVAGL